MEIGLYREISSELYQNILILTSGNRNKLAYAKVALMDYIQLNAGIYLHIKRDHYIEGYTLQYLPNIHGITGEASHFDNPAQFKYVLQQIYDFLIYDEEKHKDLNILNQWINHGDEKEYISGLAVINRLVLAKYMNDPLYVQLVDEALSYVQRNRFFKQMTLEQFHEKLENKLKECQVN